MHLRRWCFPSTNATSAFNVRKTIMYVAEVRSVKYMLYMFAYDALHLAK